MTGPLQLLGEQMIQSQSDGYAPVGTFMEGEVNSGLAGWIPLTVEAVNELVRPSD